MPRHASRLIQEWPRGLWDPTEENLRIAREALWEGWTERAAERMWRVPQDTSGACIFSSLLCLHLFGGRIVGNYNHQFLRLPDGSRLDLCEKNRDVQEILENGGDPWRERGNSWGSKEHLEAMESCLPRVFRWVERFEARIHPSIEMSI